MWMEGGNGDVFVSAASSMRDREEERQITDEPGGKRKLLVG